MRKLGYRPELDGVRGVAILLVIVAHLQVPGFRAGGTVGVTLFFVLSGFLITSLLMEEFRDQGRVRLGAFYIRRGLRLLPALVALIAAVGVYQVGAHGTTTLGRDVAASLFYVANWFRAAGASLGLLGHTWSLAIEEQFYVIWPALLLVVRRRRVLLALALIGAAASSVVRVLLWDGADSINRVYFGTDTRADALLLGCALAIWLASGHSLRPGKLTLATATLLLAAATPLTPPAAVYVAAPTMAAIGGALLIAWLVAGSRRRGGALACWPLRQTGRISYGLYLWHIPLFHVLLPRLDGTPLAARGAICILLAYALALLSYRYVERPFLRLKESRPKERADRHGSAPLTSPAQIS